jgi:transmembrane 9 superfamily protein 3
MPSRLAPSRRGTGMAQIPTALVVFFLCLPSAVFADEYDHKYATGDRVILWENKVGPYNNPQETYNYHELPFCAVSYSSSTNGRDSKGDSKPTHKWGGLGEILQGNELIDSRYEFLFGVDKETTTLCAEVLTQANVRQFKKAIKKHYWYEFFMDDLPIWGFVGENVKTGDGGFARDGGASEDENTAARGHRNARHTDPLHVMHGNTKHHGSHGDDSHSAGVSQTLVYTHKRFEIGINGDRIVAVNLVNENPKPLVAGSDLKMTYQVTWTPSETAFARRFERYLDYNFFEHQIHWFSIFNSFMMVIFLTGLVSMILMRTLRNDYAKYAVGTEGDEETVGASSADHEESGWKLVHGDVFRAPNHLSTLAALLGTGTQMTLLVFFVILITIFGAMYEGKYFHLTHSASLIAHTRTRRDYYLCPLP